jgi:hypothetical protein
MRGPSHPVAFAFLLRLAAGAILLAACAGGALAAPPAVRACAAPGGLPGTEGLAGDNYAVAITPLGDLADDGQSDYAVAAPAEIGPAGATGAVHVLYKTPGAPRPETVLRGDQVGAYFGQSIAGVGDVNGDGYPDLLVGEPFATVNGNAYAGKAFLYLGGADGMQTTPAWTLQGDSALAYTGWSVAWVGDANGDGYDDWLVGAFGGSSGTGAAYLFHGGAGPLATTPAWTYRCPIVGAYAGYCVAGAGDVNADGYADVLVGAPMYPAEATHPGAAMLFLGHANHPSLAPDRVFYGQTDGSSFGQALTGAGDVNGDGYGDFAIAAPAFSVPVLHEGRVDVFYGEPSVYAIGQTTPLANSVIDALFGNAVARAGDVNGDGLADLVVGAYGMAQLTNRGSAYIYLGTREGMETTPWDVLTSDSAGVNTGYCVGTLGDVNGDGFSDVFAGAPSNGGHADVVVREGDALGGSDPQLVAVGDRSYDQLGRSVAVADVTGDGFDDLVLGSDSATRAEQDDGTVAAYLGGPDGFVPVPGSPDAAAAPAWEVDGAGREQLGFSLSTAGDVNGDGYEDIVIGAPFHVGAFDQQGEAQLYYGSPTGLTSAPAWRVEGAQADGLFGQRVAGGGDLNGDGYDDVVVGSPESGLGLSAEGVADVYLGSPFGLAHQPAIALHGGQADAGLGEGCAIVGDVNGDGLDDLVVGEPGYANPGTQDGRLLVYLGSPTGIHAAPAQTIPAGASGSYFGANVQRIGDVNGDGYADVAVGAPQFANPELNEGRVLVYHGSPAGLVTPAAWTLEDHVSNLKLGEVGLAAAGDVNGDGYDDLLVGSPHAAALGTDGGRVRVFLGGPGGLAALPDLDLDGQAGVQLGRAVQGSADFDGDGFDDLAFTAPNQDAATHIVAGSGSVIYGGSSVLAPGRRAGRPVAARRADGTAPIAPGLWSGANTSVRLRAHARSAGGRTRLRLESEIKSTSVPFGRTGHAFSAWQPTAAVVPGLGSSTTFDLAVGGLTAATGYHWRARYRSGSPFYPFTPWLSTRRRGATERAFATSGAARPVGVDPGGPPTRSLALLPAAPNPCVAGTALAFDLPHAGSVRLDVYDLSGRHVRTLFAGPAPAGRNRATWDGRDAAGRAVRAGAYFLQLAFDGERRDQKAVILR